MQTKITSEDGGEKWTISRLLRGHRPVEIKIEHSGAGAWFVGES